MTSIIKQLQVNRFFFLFILFFTACQSNDSMNNDTIDSTNNNTMNNETSLNDEIINYISSRHQVKALDLKVIKQRNESNYFDKYHPYYVTYRTEELDYRIAEMYFFRKDSMEVTLDTYSEEITCLIADQNIENEGGDIPFVIYNRIMSRHSDYDLNKSNYPLDELQKKIFEGAEFQILVLVTAPDIIENKRKYEEFHIEIMRRLKNQHIENGSIQFIFLDDEIELENSRTSPRQPITASNPIKQHTLQRWRSIHKIKWYDMVKDRPDKVLKYGQIYKK